MAHAARISPTSLPDLAQRLQAKLPAVIDQLPILPDLRGKYLLDLHASKHQPPPIWQYSPLGLHQLPCPRDPDHHELALLTSLRPDEGPILDLGAGYGRVSAWLREQVFDVITADPSPGARLLYRLRRWDNIANLSPLELTGKRNYAAVVSLSNALNMAPSDEKLALALGNISHALKRDGVLIASIVCQNPTIPTNELAPLVTWLYSYHRSPWQKITIPTIDHTLDLLKKNRFKITHTTTTDNNSYPRLSFRATKP